MLFLYTYIFFAIVSPENRGATILLPLTAHQTTISLDGAGLRGLDVAIILQHPAAHHLVSNVTGSTVSRATCLSIQFIKLDSLESFAHHITLNFLKVFHCLFRPIWLSSGV
jgi:hypothetical protein